MSNDNSTDTLNPILAALIAEVTAKVERRTRGSAASEGKRANNAAFSQGEKRKRATLRQVHALAGVRDLLAAYGDCAATHLAATRTWLGNLGASGRFSPGDSCALLAAAGPESNDGDMLLLALAVGEERSDKAGNLLPLASVVRVLRAEGAKEASRNLPNAQVDRTEEPSDDDADDDADANGE